LSCKVEKGLVAETRDNLKGVETNWWNVGIGIYCWSADVSSALSAERKQVVPRAH